MLSSNTMELKVEVPGARRMENLRSRGKASSSSGVAEPQGQTLTGQLALVQERERRRIARGLHDVVGHSLALARMQLAQLLATEPSAERREALAQVGELLGRAVEETRSLTFE